MCVAQKCADHWDPEGSNDGLERRVKGNKNHLGANFSTCASRSGLKAALPLTTHRETAQDFY